jgi:hypothetical protein
LSSPASEAREGDPWRSAWQWIPFPGFAATGNDTTRLNVTLDVITGLVPVIPMLKSAAPHRIGMDGTSPAMTTEGVISDSQECSSQECYSQECSSEESPALQHLATLFQGCCKACCRGVARLCCKARPFRACFITVARKIDQISSFVLMRG